MKINMRFFLFFAKFFSERDFFQTTLWRKSKHILCSKVPLPLPKICLLRDKVEKHRRSGQATDENTAPAHCMLDTKSYNHTLGMCNINCFSTTKMVARTRLRITPLRPFLIFFILSLLLEDTAVLWHYPSSLYPLIYPLICIH
jgi:hypothetical protein